MELCHSGLKALVMNNYCEGREHGRIQNKDTAWRGQLLKSRCMPWIIHLEKSHTLQMKACQNGSCVSPQLQSQTVLSINQSIIQKTSFGYCLNSQTIILLLILDDLKMNRNISFWIFKTLESVYIHEHKVNICRVMYTIHPFFILVNCWSWSSFRRTRAFFL